MSNPERARKRATVTGDPKLGRNDQCCLQRRQPGILRLHLRDQRKEKLDLISVCAHAASRLRRDTMIDFEVGVSLSSPALPNGTSTFSSG